MSKFIDSVIAYRILRMLVTPFEETDAFRLGIIDAKGKELKKMSQFNTMEEREAYTILHRMVFRLKRIINKVPLENKKFLNFAAALALIKEHANDTTEPLDLEQQFIRIQNQDLTEEMILVETYVTNKYIKTFKQFSEEVVANNAAATPGVAGMTEPVVPAKNKLNAKVFRRKNNVTGTN